MRYARRTSCGFTMFELIVVFVLIGLIGGVVLSMAGDSAQSTATAAARIVMQDLEYAQSEAICRQAPITVAFNPGANSYSLSGDDGILTHPLTKQDFIVNLGTASGGSGASLTAADFGGSTSVTFTSTGEPVLPGTETPISSDSNIVVSCRGASSVIRISPIIGKIYAGAEAESPAPPIAEIPISFPIRVFPRGRRRR